MQKLKLFIGLTFDQGSHLCRKIDGFRQRFDSTYLRNSTTHMSLFAPFVINASDLKELVFEMEDELENFYYGHNSTSSMKFTAVDVFEQKKKAILNFKPQMSEDFIYLQESLHALAQRYVYDREHKTKIGKSFLAMGRFYDAFSISDAISTISREFDTPFQLGLRSISIFTKQSGEWRESLKLMDFEKANEINRNQEYYY